MTKLSLPSIDLDAIGNPIAGDVRLGGKKYDVLQATPATVKLLQSVRDEDESLSAAITAVLRCVPDLEDHVLGKLGADQMKAILAISCRNLELVAQLDPNHDPNAASPAMATPSLG